MIQNTLRSNLKHRHQKLPRLLVTGCAGSIGKMMNSAFMSVFDYDLIGIDMNPRIRRYNPLNKDFFGYHTQKFDYIYEQQKLADILKEGLVDRVAHLAEVSREEANLDYQLAKKYNVEGTKILIDLIKQNSDLKKIHLFYRSDMSVYGDRTENPKISVTDTPKPNPHDYYALTKLEGENLVKESGIPHTIFRFAPVCDHLNWWIDLHPTFFYFELDQKIEWITSRDAAKAIKQAMYKAEMLDKQTFNIGGGEKLVIRHRDFMKNIMNSRGVMIDKPIDFNPTAFANTNLYGGQYTDSDYSNSQLGYRMQPIDTAYLRQVYRYPFFMRWFNKRLPVNYVIQNEYEEYSHIYQAHKLKETEFLNRFFDPSKVLPKEEVQKNLENSMAIDQDEKDLVKRQLRNAKKKDKQDFIEAMNQRNIREEIERKWRERREEKIINGEDPDVINLDEIDKLEAEEKLQEELTGVKVEDPKPKELTEEEKIRQQEKEEEEREMEKRAFGF